MGVPSGYTKVGSAIISKEGVVGNIWTAMEEAPLGTLGIVQLQGPLLGPTFDMAGVEQVVQTAFNAQGVDATVLDCYGEGWSTGYIRFEGSPFLWTPFLIALGVAAAGLAILGAVITVGVFIFSFVQEPGKFIVPFVVIGALVIGGLMLVGGKK